MSSIARPQSLRCAVALLLLLAIPPGAVLNGQVPQHLRLELLNAQMLGRDFKRRQSDFRAWKLEERRRVPGYNAQLNGAVVDFHNHISKDDHYLLTKVLFQEVGADNEVN